MRVYESLLRSSRRQLETERRLLAGLLALSACLSADAERLAMSPEDESEEIEERRERLRVSIAEVESQIQRARSAVGEALAELERREIAASNQTRHGERPDPLSSVPGVYYR